MSFLVLFHDPDNFAYKKGVLVPQFQNLLHGLIIIQIVQFVVEHLADWGLLENSHENVLSVSMRR